MSLKFKNDQRVRQIVKPIEGTVVSKSIVGDDIVYSVQWEDEQGVHERTFTEGEIEPIDD